MKTVLTFVFIMVISYSSIAQKESRAERRERRLNETKELLESKQFVFNVKMVLPQSGRSIDVSTDNYDFIVVNDSVISYLPFFGRAYSAGYGDEGGYKFESLHEDYKVTVSRNGKSYTATFTVKLSNDWLQCIINASSPEAANLSITGNKKAFISYTGDLSSKK